MPQDLPRPQRIVARTERPGDPSAGVTRLRPLMRDLLGPLRRGVDLYLAGDLEGAEGRIRAVLAQDPNLPQAHHHLAVVLHARSQTVEAVRHLRIALDLDPHLVGACERLELYLAELHRGRSSTG